MSEEGAVMRLPEKYVAELLVLLEPACSRYGLLRVTDLDTLVGKAGRVAYVVPAARPFVATFWAALAAARAAVRDGILVGPPGFIPSRRVCYGAAWLKALLSENESCPLRLERLVTAHPPPRLTSDDCWRIEFDGSIYGGGAVLRNSDGVIVEFFSVVWTGNEAEHLLVEPWNPAYQTFWELATLVLALCTWGGFSILLRG